MTKYPNRNALFEACNIYRDAMRSFIISRLRQMRGKQVEDVIIDSLPFKRADEIDRILLQSNRNIQSVIDINDFPHLVNKNWEDAFAGILNDDKIFRNQLWLIVECRNADWAHPSERDVESEGTRAYLFFIADVLGKINADARYELENIRDQLFPNDTAEHLEKTEEKNTELQKLIESQSERLEELETEWITSEERFTDKSNLLESTEAEKAELKKRLSEKEDTLSKLSDQLRTVEAEKAELEERLEMASTWLEDVETELTAYQVHLARTLGQLKGVKNEFLVEPMRLSEGDAESTLKEDKTNSSKTSPIGTKPRALWKKIKPILQKPVQIGTKTNNPNDMDDNQSVTKQLVVPSEFSGEWTVEQIRNLVSEEMRNFHEANFPEERCNVFYRKVAEIQNLIEAEGWGLKTRFVKKSCRFWLTSNGVTQVKSVFGIHLQYNPLTLHVRMMKRDAEELKRQCGCEFYEVSKNQYADYVYYYVPDDIAELRPVLAFAYKKHSGN